MSKGVKYTKEFKQEAVNQVTIHGYSVNDVAERLGICTKSLYAWRKTLSKPTKASESEQDLRAENARLKKQLKRAEQERNILKEAAEDSSHQSNRYTKTLICMRTLNETIKTYIYHRRERPCF